MARKAGPQGTSRPALTRQRALAAAVVVADLEGLDRLTMRRLAQALGVEAMSLYHHVANKDDILDGMVDVVFAEIELPAIDVDWKSAMQARSHRQWRHNNRCRRANAPLPPPPWPGSRWNAPHTPI